jgi:HSP20 family protein
MAIMHRDSSEELTHWEPFRGIDRLHEEMNHLFERFLPHSNGEASNLSFVPAAEMEETDDAIHLKLEVPGMSAKDLNVEVTDASVVIQGERKSESRTEEKGMIRSDFSYGQFERRLALPSPVQSDQVQAECKNGVLSLTLPKVASEPRQAVKIAVS